MTYCILVVQILLLLVDKFTTDGTEVCEEVANNLRIVKSCPKSKDEWDRAAQDMKCNELAERRNCKSTEKQLQYHCVINTYMNDTLEVCAPRRFIFGFCAEFNVAGRVIQSHYGAKCNETFPKCDYIYSSENAYQFPDCYKLVYKNRDLKATEHSQVRNTSDETEHSEKTRKITFVVYSSCLMLCGICTIPMLLLLRKVKKRRETHISINEEETHISINEEETHISINEEETHISINEEETQLYGFMEPLERRAESKPSIKYFYLKTKDFTFFQYVYNLIKDYPHRIKTDEKTKKQTNAMPMDVIIKIGVVGEFTDYNLKFLPEDERNTPSGAREHICEAIPLLCFQNNLSLHSALEALRKESACHKILIKSEKGVDNVPFQVVDSIIIIPQNKEQIIEAITCCLMHLMLPKFL